jgi:uncharacterized protein (TIGR03435 family)
MVALVLTLASSRPGAQSPGFEVASIKPNRSGAGVSTFAVRPGGRLVATNASLKELILWSYQLLDFQLEGAPDWLTSERYDVNAKAEGELPPLPPSLPSDNEDAPLVFLMVRSLLADRAHLAIRTETRDMTRYSLVRLGPRDVGPQLKASTLDCDTMRAERARAARAAGTPLVPPPPPPPPERAQRPPCTAGSAPGYHSGAGMSLSSLVRSLSRVLGRAIVDETGLTGPYDWTLEYAPDALAAIRPDGTPAVPATDLPSLPAALEEQLGLKLGSRRGPVRILVIEHVERPSPD